MGYVTRSTQGASYYSTPAPSDATYAANVSVRLPTALDAVFSVSLSLSLSLSLSFSPSHTHALTNQTLGSGHSHQDG